MKHGVDAYRKGCRCDVCRAANTERCRTMRLKRLARIKDSEFTHGASAYGNWGCRCDVCCAAWKEKMARDHAERASKARAGHPAVPHGNAGYNWGCRCEICMAACREKLRQRAEAEGRKFRPGLPGPAPGEYVHGQVQRYWQDCRCEKCCQAYRQYRKPFERARTRDPEARAYQRRWIKIRNDRSRDVARNNGQEWTGPELEIASRKDLSATQVAAMLGRTVNAVYWKRKQLRDDPRAAALAGTELAPSPAVAAGPEISDAIANQRVAR